MGVVMGKRLSRLCVVGLIALAGVLLTMGVQVQAHNGVAVLTFAREAEAKTVEKQGWYVSVLAKADDACHSPHITKVKVKGNKVTLRGSFWYYKNSRDYKAMRGKRLNAAARTFVVSGKTRYRGYSGVSDRYRYSKGQFFGIARKFNALGLTLRVKGGKVVEASLDS